MFDKHNVYMLKTKSKSIYNRTTLQSNDWRENYSDLFNNEV